MVKANAYGHGIERIWSAIGATDGFALLNLEEAITLRERGWKGPILMLEGFFHAQDLEIYDQHRLTTCVHSNWQLKALQNARLKAPLDIYLKVNSGMNRLGFQPDRVLTVWQQLRAMANVGEMTHSSTGVPIPACGQGVKSTASISIETVPTVMVRTPSTKTGVPVGAWRG